MGKVTHPRAWLSIEGARIPLLSGHVSLSRTKSSDSFNVTIPLGHNGMDTEYWGNLTEAEAEVFLSSDGGAGLSVIKADVKTINMSLAGRTVKITGHDKTTKMVAKKTSEKWQNKKADEIVKDLAGRCGLSVESGSVEGMAGKLYQIDFNKISDHHTFWSLVQHLADLEGMQAFVKGDKLLFQDLEYSDGEYVLYYVPPTPESYMRGNWMTLDLQRNLDLSKGAKVKVQSYNRKKKKVVSHEESAGAGNLEYSYRHPELDQAQAGRIAKKRLKENLKHELTVSANIPGDETLTPTMKVTLVGTNSDFDQIHYMKTVDHEYEVGSFRTLLTFNNQSDKNK